ncbi:transglycosylase SLT domain-containing protein [Alloyangia pacifica]|uniref:Transglycosylase SLT domain-containing protein n=1 Tax=Alloyangia pacifica TaxID=311180 RepID=A0A1I6U102_9RHOB|nr:transglycosylase SLT domain-containing protein [Alloyangia pacifica]SDH32637.1 Transglycosylase SLT domain-containing protein [Alloyangia pacifica]SFS95038.1 Transglycosylase SLT domain-containing protein [Alloyangia pacifica]
MTETRARTVFRYDAASLDLRRLRSLAAARVRCLVLALVWLLLWGLADAGRAATGDAQRCDRAAMVAARALGVPLPVMRAVTRVETGRRRDGVLQPWPWTVNLGGDGYWFDSAAEARAFAAAQVARGRRNMDIGCFQVNLRWHGGAFPSTDEMFDPEENAAYAARFLKRLRAERGDWDRAVAAYHSRTPKFADRYIARYRAVRAALDDAPVASPGANAPLVNRFPLLIGEGQRAAGSLTPLGRGLRPFLDLRGRAGG